MNTCGHPLFPNQTAGNGLCTRCNWAEIVAYYGVSKEDTNRVDPIDQDKQEIAERSNHDRFS